MFRYIGEIPTARRKSFLARTTSGSAAHVRREVRSTGDESVAGAQVHLPPVPVVPTAGSPRPTPRRRRVDLTSRFLQFGVLENQCGQSYLAVPIAAVPAVASVWFCPSPLVSLFLPPSPSLSFTLSVCLSLSPLLHLFLLRNRKTRSDERKSTLHHA